MREYTQLGIKHVWVHWAGRADSGCTGATVDGRSQGVTVIDGGCPLMFGPAADIGHQFMRFMMAGSSKRPTRA
jgi:uncharacterized protein